MLNIHDIKSTLLMKWIQYGSVCSIAVLFGESGMGAATTLTLDHGLQLCNGHYNECTMFSYSTITQSRYIYTFPVQYLALSNCIVMLALSTSFIHRS